MMRAAGMSIYGHTPLTNTGVFALRRRAAPAAHADALGRFFQASFSFCFFDEDDVMRCCCMDKAFDKFDQGAGIAGALAGVPSSPPEVG
jgi:hypothetical protein